MNLTKTSKAYKRPPSGIIRAMIGGLAVGIVVASLLGCAAANSLLGGNTRKSAVAEIAWEFAENAILIELDADPRLNDHGGEAHTLVLGVYQMEDSATFYKLVADASLLAKGLESGKGGDGFVQFVRYVVTPGQRTILSATRAQKAKFVGIVAGYYHMNAATSTRLFEVPLTVISDGLVTKKYKAAPATLVLRLNLGAEGVVNAQRLNRDPTEKKTLAAVPLDGGGKELNLTDQEIKRAAEMGSTIRKLDK